MRQQAKIVLARQIDGAELRQMLGDELDIEQGVAAFFQPGDQMGGATLLALSARLNMLSPKKALPSDKP